MPEEDVSASTRYRRLARECLEIAHTFPGGERRTVLLQMAQVWQRLADEYADTSAPLLRPIESEQPVVQQQQQIQPKDDDKQNEAAAIGVRTSALAKSASAVRSRRLPASPRGAPATLPSRGPSSSWISQHKRVYARP